MNRERLKAVGIDYGQGVERFVGRSELYESYLLKFFTDAPLNGLDGLIRDGNYEEAFHKAHDIKGMAGNLSINGLFKEIGLLVEALRNGDEADKCLEALCRAAIAYQNAESAVKA